MTGRPMRSMLTSCSWSRQTRRDSTSLGGRATYKSMSGPFSAVSIAMVKEAISSSCQTSATRLFWLFWLNRSSALQYEMETKQLHVAARATSLIQNVQSDGCRCELHRYELQFPAAIRRGSRGRRHGEAALRRKSGNGSGHGHCRQGPPRARDVVLAPPTPQPWVSYRKN
jgi:hypothetical protein